MHCARGFLLFSRKYSRQWGVRREGGTYGADDAHARFCRGPDGRVDEVPGDIGVVKAG